MKFLFDPKKKMLLDLDFIGKGGTQVLADVPVGI